MRNCDIVVTTCRRYRFHPARRRGRKYTAKLSANSRPVRVSISRPAMSTSLRGTVNRVIRTRSSPVPRVACIGECMIELREQADGRLTRGFGGDTLNTAIYLARLGVT